MFSTVCTLFEGNYHYGVGALVNSLYHHGFRGTVWVGYRGELPPWATPIIKNEKYYEYLLDKNCSIRFVKLDTESHFTNYKPTFMLDLWEHYCSDAEAIFYFDPDIVIKCRWSYYEEWVMHGIALCEDVNSPILSTHPLRMSWIKFFLSHNLEIKSNSSIYVNGGFIGIKEQDKSFLILWKRIWKIISFEFPSSKDIFKNDPTYIFNKIDQDALNIALMYNTIPTSIIGKEGMDFISGGYTMSHAIGKNKPWNRAMLLLAIRGKGVRLVDDEYFKYSQGKIKLYSDFVYRMKRIDRVLAKVISIVF